MSGDAVCATCGHEFKNGDLFIEGASSGFVGGDAGPSVDDLMADLFGGEGGNIRICERCTEPGGSYSVKVFSAAGDTE